ncbi:MAG: hypothetical protein ACREOE_04990, partial [Gemmatimonadales bacterium]
YQPWLDNQRRLHALITELEPSARKSPTQTPAGSANQDHVGTARLTCGQASGQHTKRAMLETCGSAGKGASVKEGVPSR